MFSDGGALRPGGHRGFKPHASHLFPWLRNSLKPHHRSDLGLNGAHKPPAETRGKLAPLEQANGLGFLSGDQMGSIQAKDRDMKGEPRCNGVGPAQKPPVALREHRVLPESMGRQREYSPARWSQSPELDPDPEVGVDLGQGPQGLGQGATSVQDYYSEYTLVKNHNSHLHRLHPHNDDGAQPPIRKFIPLLATTTPVPTPATPEKFKGQEANYKVPVVVCTDEGREKLWHYARHTYHRSNLQSATWLNADSQGLIDNQQSFSASFSYTKELGKNFHSQRDLSGLKEMVPGAVNGPSSLHGVIFSTEVPQRNMAHTKTLRGHRKPRPNSEHVSSCSQNQTWVQVRPASGGDARCTRKEIAQPGPRCNRKAVRDQIKRVLDNLEKVLGGLKDVHQEMKEVVEQIDYLTSSMDLNEEEEEEEEGEDGGRGRASGATPARDSSSSSSGVTVVSNHHMNQDKPRPSSTTRRCCTFSRTGSQSPQNTSSSLEKVRPPQSAHTTESSLKRFRPPAYPSSSVRADSLPRPPNPACRNFSSPPRRTSPLPTRPPTPGLSPLTVNLQQPNNMPGPLPGHQPRSPGASSTSTVGPVSPLSLQPSQVAPPTALSPSVIVETKVVSCPTAHGDLPSATPLSPSQGHPLFPSCPPPGDFGTQPNMDGGERQAPLAGLVQASSRDYAPTSADARRAAPAQSRRGRKPPPYPHNGHFERTKKAKEPRQAPPYPEKRRLLSTTV